MGPAGCACEGVLNATVIARATAVPCYSVPNVASTPILHARGKAAQRHGDTWAVRSVISESRESPSVVLLHICESGGVIGLRNNGGR